MASLRRAPATSDEAAHLRLRKPSGLSIQAVASPDRTSSPDTALPPRRSSSFSDFSISEARRVLDPLPAGGQLPTEKSHWASLSLACALGPALAGLLFKNGNVVVADLMLLGFSGVFLHWCITQPWIWYRTVQLNHELAEASADAGLHADADADADADTDTDADADSHPEAPVHRDASVPPPTYDAGSTSSSSQPGADQSASFTRTCTNSATSGTQSSSSIITPSTTPPGSSRSDGKQKRQVAPPSRRYAREMFLLALCFLCPLLGAYLLHKIRSQLSRPSGSLVSDFNLTIFVMASELRVVSHVISLVHSHTLLPPPGMARLHSFEAKDSLLAHLGQLEARLEKIETRQEASSSSLLTDPPPPNDAQSRQEATMVRGVRNAIQPELDALNRAVRRYEKKATVLALQTDARLGELHTRLDNTVTLAAAAARQHRGGGPRVSVGLGRLVQQAANSLVAAVVFPFSAALDILVFPLGVVLRLVKRGRPAAKQPTGSRTTRGGRMGPTGSKLGGDWAAAASSTRPARRL